MTMTSKEMADLTEKRHDNVKRTMDTLANQGVIAQPQIEDGEKSANGVVEKVYRIGKRDSYVIVAQLSLEFAARLVDRWQELEEQARPAQPTIPQTLPEALRLAADLADMKARADAALAIAAPKAEALDRLALADGSFCIRDAAKTLQVKEKVLKQKLIECRWMYQRPMGTGYLAYSDKLQQGLVEHKVTQGNHATKAMDAAIAAQQWATQAQPREAMESSNPRQRHQHLCGQRRHVHGGKASPDFRLAALVNGLVHDGVVVAGFFLLLEPSPDSAQQRPEQRIPKPNESCVPAQPYLKNTCPRKSLCRTSRMADQWTSSWLLQTDLVWRAV
jgi:phage antirepressor YoqD-like protein